MVRYPVVIETNNYNTVVIKCDKNAYVTFNIIGIDAEGHEICIYKQDEISTQRICWIGEQPYSELFVECEGSLALSANAIHLRRRQSVAIHEYIVLGKEMLSKPLHVSGKTTDLITIGMCRCNEKGEVFLSNEDMFNRCVEYIKEGLQGRHVRLWSCLCIGRQADGWFASKDVRCNLVKNVQAHLRKYDFDGLDIDYEYPETDAAWSAFGELLVELKNAFKLEKRLLSCALAPWGCYFTEEAVKALDYVNGMIYDLFDEQGNHQSYQCYVNAINFFRNKGYADSVICAGIGFYGRPADRSAVWKEYSYFYDKYGDELDPSCNLLEDVWFNGQTMCKDKTALAAVEGIDGIMIWHHDSDIDFENPLSLMRGCCEVIDAVMLD